MTDDFDQLDKKLAMFEEMADTIEESVAPQICEIMRSYALDRLAEKVYDGNSNPVTGNLQNSVETAGDIVIREGQTTVRMGIQTSADYAKYIEFGTGIHGSNDYNGHISEGVTFKNKERWFQHNPDYQGEFGKNNDPRHLEALRRRQGFGTDDIITGYEEWIPRYSQHPRPFMRPALYDNVELFKDIIKGELTGVFE